MKLDELHILQWQSGAQCHRIAVAGADMRLGRREIGAAAASGRQHHDMRPKQMQGAVFKTPRDDPAARAVLHDEIEREVFDKKLGIMPEALLVEGMQQRVAGPVGGGAGAFGQPLAPLHGVAAKRALIDMAVLGARERHAEMFELDDRRHCILTHVFDRVLVAEPVGALDRVVHVPAPVVLAHIAECRTDAALRRRPCGCGSGTPC